MNLQLPWVSPEVVDQIVLVGKAEAPSEACGIITPDSAVVQLPNSSSSPASSFAISSGDLVNALTIYAEQHGVNLREMPIDHFIVWHTHPGGNIGPSRGDMREKIKGFRYVVVSIPGGEAVLF